MKKMRMMKIICLKIKIEMKNERKQQKSCGPPYCACRKIQKFISPFFIEYFHLFFVPLGGGSFSSIPYSRVRCARVLYCVCVVFGHVWCMSSVVFNLSCHHKFFFPFDFILYAGPQSNTNTASQKFVTCLNECFYDTSEKLSPKVEQKRKKKENTNEIQMCVINVF